MQVYEDKSRGRVTQWFESIKDLADSVQKADLQRASATLGLLSRDSEWFGGVSSLSELLALARDGWAEEASAAMRVADSVVADVDREFELPAWHARYDVSGSDVDVARFLSGEPENMITFELVPTPGTGRVVSLSVNIIASAIVPAESLIARGRAVVALVTALESLGLRTEVYADGWIGRVSSNGGPRVRRSVTLVKHAGDVLDTPVLMFALAHPAFMRGMVLGAYNLLPEEWANGTDLGNGNVIDPEDTEGLPEGTLSVDASLRLGRDPITESKVREWIVARLRELGLITD